VTPSLIHIVHRTYLNGGWAVHREGKQRATFFFDTRDEAIKRGKKLARAERGELWIHDERNEKKIVERLDFRKKAKPSRQKKKRKS
jgi:hypothetical protein